MINERFTLGINYWPRRKAMFWWQRFDAGEVREELAHIADLGIHVVRFCLMWEDFQPQPDQVDSAMLGNLQTVLDAAQAAGVVAMPTLFTGHMSGANWLPAWAMQPAEGAEVKLSSIQRFIVAGRDHPGLPRDLYTDPHMLAAQRLFIDAVVPRFADHAALWGWDLGNESDLVCVAQTPDIGRRWLDAFIGRIRACDPDARVTFGSHQLSLLADNGLRVDHLGAICDPLVMHAYPIYALEDRGPGNVDFVRFCLALTEGLGGKPVLLQEFGACTAPPGEPGRWIEVGPLRQRTYLASEEEHAAYVGAVLQAAYDAGALGAWIWCYADYTEDLWALPPCDLAVHERTFGLVRRDGSEKPAAQVVRRFAGRLGRGELGPPGTHRRRIQVNADDYYRDPAGNFARLYADFIVPRVTSGPRPSRRSRGKSSRRS